MRVDELVLEDFRNYRSGQLLLGPGVNLVVGKNAQGKTNLLEAIYCLGGLGSPRSGQPALIREGAESALLHARVRRGERVVDLDLELHRIRGHRALINKMPVPGARALGELSVSVFFGPDELALVKGSPDRRRRFLDELTVKLRPVREGLRREWERVLRQRNTLLKTAPRGSHRVGNTLEVWDEALCKTGASLTAARLEVLAQLRPFASSHYEAISGGDRLELSYQSGWLGSQMWQRVCEGDSSVDEHALREALSEGVASSRTREMERGVSLVGPHRDDVLVQLSSAVDGGQPLLDAREFASQGEQRSAALALKLGEYELLTNILGEKPVLLLDDVFSELDPGRRAWLGEAVTSSGQVIVSSAEPGAVEAARAERVFEVSSGTVTVRG